MHHPTDRIAHTTAFVTPVVEHWLEREISQWVHPMKDRSNDPSHHERTLLWFCTSGSKCPMFVQNSFCIRKKPHVYPTKNIPTVYVYYLFHVCCIFCEAIKINKNKNKNIYIPTGHIKYVYKFIILPIIVCKLFIYWSVRQDVHNRLSVIALYYKGQGCIF